MVDSVTVPLPAQGGVVEFGDALPQGDNPGGVVEFGDTIPEGDAVAIEGAAPKTGLGFFDRATVGIQGVLDQVLAAVQGTSPIVEDIDGNKRMTRLGDLIESDAGFQYEDDSGKWHFIDGQAHVVLRDKNGRLSVFARSPETEENALIGLGRIMGTGLVTNPVVGGPVTKAAQTAGAFDRMNVQPTVPMVTEGRLAKVGQNVLLDTPGAGGAVEQNAARMVEQTASAAEDVAGMAGAAKTRDTAGAVVRSGVENFAKLDMNDPSIPFSVAVKSPSRNVGFRGKASALYDKIDEFISAEISVGITNAKSELKTFGEKFASAPKLGNVLEQPLIKRISAALEDVDGLTYQELKDFRSAVGAELASPAILANPAQARLKTLYAALSKDMRAAAESAGPEALKSFERANRFYNAGIKRIEDALAPLLKSATDEALFEKVLSLAKDKGRAGVAQLNQLKRSLTPDEFGEVVAVTIRQMGKPTASTANVLDDTDFSPVSFISNYSKLSDKGKGVLFDGALRGPLDDLLTVAQKQTDLSRLKGHSGTPRILIVAASGAGIGTGEVFSTIGLLTAANVAARVILSPRVARWIADAPAKEIGPHLARLRAIAVSEPEIEDDVNAYADYVEQLMGGAIQ